ncbi:MAG: chemotaxis protein CheW, partial [Thermodesulfobacteriota bacterium]|nr:chemotaxis protein CheW [Thermodesulfobacteriota bacterium]
RVVRELSKTADKKVDFVVKGGDIKLDRAILDELWDPLVHLIRNALDHGIEPPAERKRKGKDVEGKISLWASREKDAILVGVEDDGNGIDIEKVREAAVKKNIILDKETFDEQSNEVLQILCTPNFTTSQRVTQVSGRGVGLDIVKSKVESLGGSLLVSSQPEKGSNWIIKLPTSLAIFHSLLFTLDSHVFAIPITKTLYTGEVFLDDEDYHKDEQTFVFRGTAVPIIDLKSVLDIPSKNEENRKAFLSIAIVEAKNRNIGLLVDEFVGVHQIFVKPLGQPLEKINAYCGVTFLGNGNAALLLDLEKLL